jgi:hypothetical protein
MCDKEEELMLKLGDMSFEELHDCASKLREENRQLKIRLKEHRMKLDEERLRLQGEVDNMKNRGTLGLTKFHILSLDEFQEIKNRVAEHAVEIQILREKMGDSFTDVLKF